MSYPNLFIIGEPKCGTTIIHEYLSQHKDIFMPYKKEPNYFATDLIRQSKEHNGEKYHMFFPGFNEKDYFQLFDGVEHSYTGEATVVYAKSKEAAKNIYEFNSKSRIIYSIREPVSFLQSRHGHLVKIGAEDEKDFLKALDIESVRKEGRKLPENLRIYEDVYYSEWIRFTEHLQRYLDHFPEEQIKVLIYEEFKKDNQKTTDEITDFLGLDKMMIEQKEVNIRAKPKYPELQRFFQNYKVRTVAEKIFPYRLREKTAEWINPWVEEKSPELAEEEKIRLMKQFKPEVEKINDLLHEHKFMDSDFDLVKYRGYDKV